MRVDASARSHYGESAVTSLGDFVLPHDPTFAGNTTAIQIGESLWLGSYRGDRIAIVPAP